MLPCHAKRVKTATFLKQTKIRAIADRNFATKREGVKYGQLTTEIPPSLDFPPNSYRLSSGDTFYPE